MLGLSPIKTTNEYYPGFNVTQQIHGVLYDFAAAYNMHLAETCEFQG